MANNRGTACSRRQSILRERQHAKSQRKGRKQWNGVKAGEWLGWPGLRGGGRGGELSQEEAGMAEAKAEAGGSGYTVTTVMVAVRLGGDGAPRTQTVETSPPRSN